MSQLNDVKMPQVSYQTVRLAKGKHSSAARGACVMELASMLSGEPFTDRPESVSPVIAAFLRRYNDLVDDEHRQDLCAYAAKIVGTAGSPTAEDARAERLIAWGDELWERRDHRLLHRLTHWLRAQLGTEPEDAAAYAALAITDVCRQTHAAALELVDELIAISSYSKRYGQTEDSAATGVNELDCRSSH